MKAFSHKGASGSIGKGEEILQISEGEDKEGDEVCLFQTVEAAEEKALT